MRLPESRTTNEELNTFLTVSRFSEEDAECLELLRPIIEPALPALTDKFYAQLSLSDEIRPYLEGRLEQLKSTHLAWLQSLFSGVYDDEFVTHQQRIGFVHVKVKVPPLFVSSSMAFLRAEIPQILLNNDLSDTIARDCNYAQCSAAIARLLDFCHFLIDGTYFKSMMDTMGISPALLNRLMTLSR